MIMDTSLEFCKELALSATSNDSTNTLDFDQAQLLSVPLALVVVVSGSPSTAKATTVSVQGSDNNSSFAELMSFTIAEADMVLKLTIKPTAADTNAKITAFLTVSPDTPREKADFPFASTIA